MYNYGKLTEGNFLDRGKNTGAVVKMLLFIDAVVAAIRYGAPLIGYFDGGECAPSPPPACGEAEGSMFPGS